MGMPEYQEFLDLAERYDQVRLDTTMTFTDFAEELEPFPRQALPRLADLGDRILLGSDFPNIPYRYLHGLLGTLSLLAAWSWTRLTQGPDPAAQRAARAVFAAAAAASLAILLPIRLWQVHAFVHPYAVAERAIQATPADLVLVDSSAMWFGADLVRNDPFLTRRPLVMELGELKPAQVQALCARYRVAVFGAAEANAAGVRLSGGASAAGADSFTVNATRGCSVAQHSPKVGP